MDNLCHTLVAGALAKTGLERAAPRATAALVVGANVPDADIVVTLFAGPGGYLVHHRGITHAAIGIALLGPLCALGLHLYSRWRDAPDRRAGFLPLLWISWVALASHFLLDWTNPYGVRPWLPFDDRWIYTDWIAIVDPWLWLGPGLALFWLTGSRRGRALWAGLALVLSAIVLLADYPPVWMQALWLVGIGAGAAGSWLGLARVRAPALAWGALAFILLYWSGAALAHRSAVAAARERARDPAHVVAAIPSPGDPSSWRIVEYGADSVHVSLLRLTGDRRPRRLGDFARGLDEPPVPGALETEAGRSMLLFARFPFAEVVRGPQGTTVYLRDARYALTEREGWGVMPIEVTE